MRKRAGERKRGRFWKVESREKKGRGQEYMGIRVWWRKIKRKKKRMDDRKKGWKNNIKKRNDNLEILPQYFHNKF